MNIFLEHHLFQRKKGKLHAVKLEVSGECASSSTGDKEHIPLRPQSLNIPLRPVNSATNRHISLRPLRAEVSVECVNGTNASDIKHFPETCIGANEGKVSGECGYSSMDDSKRIPLRPRQDSTGKAWHERLDMKDLTGKTWQERLDRKGLTKRLKTKLEIMETKLEKAW